MTMYLLNLITDTIALGIAGSVDVDCTGLDNQLKYAWYIFPETTAKEF